MSESKVKSQMNIKRPYVRELFPGERTRGVVQGVTAIGVVLSLSLGFLDLTISLLPRPSGLSSFASLLLPLGATVVVVFLLYLALWIPAGLLLRRVFNLDNVPFAVSLALFVSFALLLARLADLVRFSLSLNHLFKLALLFLLSLLFSVAGYFATKVIVASDSYKNSAIILATATPFLLAETTVLVWLQKYRLGVFFSPSALLVMAGYALVALCTLSLFFRLGPRIKSGRVLAIFLVVVVLSPFGAWIGARATRSPSGELTRTGHKIKHVILITVDTLRADALSSYGHKKGSTPHIDQLARDGILFSGARAPASWTLPSLASILTGLSPRAHTAMQLDTKLPNEVHTLAEFMRDAGYHTAAIGSSELLQPAFNLSQGYRDYVYFPKESVGASLGALALDLLFPERFTTSSDFASEAISTRALTRRATAWLELNREKEFFLWIHYLDPHLPFSPPADFIPTRSPPPEVGYRFADLVGVRAGYRVPSLVGREWIKELYDAEVRYVDDSVGELLATLKRLGLYEDSLIILTSDHGEEFWEHDGFAHGHSLYDEVLWVPLLVKLPHPGSKGRVSAMVQTPSITPTVLDLCKIDYESSNFSVGSLVPLWEQNPSGLVEEPIVSTGLIDYEDRESVIFDGLKYIRVLMTGREELYNLVRDPRERTSLVSSSPEKIEQARNLLEAHNGMAIRLRKLYGIARKQQIELDEETRERLKALGYIQ